MIVNPAAVGIDGLFEGTDGALYRAQGTGEQGELHGLGQLFLGDDGALYRAEQVNLSKPDEATANLGAGMVSDESARLEGYLLAADGTLYEITK